MQNTSKVEMIIFSEGESIFPEFKHLPPEGLVLNFPKEFDSDILDGCYVSDNFENREIMPREMGVYKAVVLVVEDVYPATLFEPEDSSCTLTFVSFELLYTLPEVKELGNIQPSLGEDDKTSEQ